MGKKKTAPAPLKRKPVPNFVEFDAKLFARVGTTVDLETMAYFTRLAGEVTTRVTCPNCKGRVPVCLACDGNGVIDCTCSECGDDHERTCRACGGTGESTGADRTPDCKMCGGLEIVETILPLHPANEWRTAS